MSRPSLQGNLHELSTRSIGSLLLSYSIPAVTGMVVMSLYNVIDRIFIGRGVGADAIAGLSITFPVMNLSTAIGVLIGAGASARVSIMLGQRDHRSAGLVLGNSLVLTLLNAIVYVSLFGVFLEPILRAFGASDATLPYAYDFLIWLLPGMMVINLCFSFNNIMRASGYPLRAMYTMIIGAVCNVILAPVFIFWLNLGIKGAAIATDISMIVSATFVMAHFMNKNTTLHFTKGTYRLKKRIVGEIVSIGAAPALVNAAACLINVIINRSLLKYGSDMAVGAAGIFTTYASLLTTIVLGICQGMQPIVGYNYGAGNIQRLRRAVWLATAVSSLICFLGSVGGLMFPHLIARLFTIDAELIQVTTNALGVAMMAFSVVGFQIVATTFFQSIGKAGKSIFLSLTRQVLFLIPMMLVLPRFFGLKGVWASFPLSDILATMVTLCMVLWQLNHLNPQLSKND